MISFRAIHKNTIENLKDLYPVYECETISYLLLENITGLNKTKIILNYDEPFPEKILEKYLHFIERLKNGEPLQYITNQAYFYGREFFVNPSVLIPRQETEILVKETIDICKNKSLKNPKILDIGTGSGCIAISLKKEIPEADIYALDVSTEALNIAKKNSTTHDTNITFAIFDVLLDKNFPFADIKFDIIVSNPPYVTISEKKLMHKNVTLFEPALALYVEDNAPLVFYNSISELAKNILNTPGHLVYEINENFSKEVSKLNISKGFTKNMVISDLNNKNRVIVSINSLNL
ncbi:MAG: peptide chain release factor N(5)-glutamine methyltransferase [Bacteroidales bacterium]|jgi:release factor glutamine methyltransferase